MAGFRSFIMARLYDSTMRKVEERCLGRWRAELLAEVSGDALEIGAGTGVNLEHYSGAVDSLVLSEPDGNMRARLRAGVEAAPRKDASIADFGAEVVDLPDESVDSVVSTLVLCSVDDQGRSLSEVHRVLRPGGALYFMEHVVADHDPTLVAWQRRVEPLWRFFCGNCHLTHDTAEAMNRAGFRMERLERDRMRGAPRIASPVIRGVARRPRAPAFSR